MLVTHTHSRCLYCKGILISEVSATWKYTTQIILQPALCLCIEIISAERSVRRSSSLTTNGWSGENFAAHSWNSHKHNEVAWITLYDSRSSERNMKFACICIMKCSSVPSIRTLWSSSKHNSRRRVPAVCIRFSRWLPFVVARPFFILLMFRQIKFSWIQNVAVCRRST